MDSAEEAYERFLAFHEARRKGEDLRRLVEGHREPEARFAKTVWFPTVRSFDDLHPEYPVRDSRGVVRYLDFAYLHGPLRLALEIDGYGPHESRASRRAFADDRHRQNDLVIDGWVVLRFAADEVFERPDACRLELQRFLGVWFGPSLAPVRASAAGLGARERDALRFLLQLDRPAQPGDLARRFGVTNQTARAWLRRLRERGLVAVHSGPRRARRYRVAADGFVIGRYL
ncbi:MAG: MarR family transcriptional regulator [Clostridia bacterium]|nr:MarR family transcriptional regulator [Clostridia bacterium]